MNGMNGNVLKTDNKSPSPDCGEEQKLISPTTPTTPMIVRITNPYSSLKYRSRYRPGPTRKLRRRAVLKNGDCNVLQSRISRRSLRFLQDIFTTLVDTQWRWTLLCFILSFLLSWLGFAVIWWLIAFTHGDFEERHLPPFQVENNWTPCVYNIFSFTSCFLFSIETQHTIGYGSRSTTEECPEAIFVMCIQSISGVMIQAFMVGIVFAKMTRPKQRTQTLLFSRNAVICQRDGELCLMFRVGDMRKSHIIGASVRAQMIRSKINMLHDLLLSNNNLQSISSDAFTGLPRLQVLDLENNYIEYIHPDAFRETKHLQDLNLGNNIFPTLPIRGLAGLLHLKTFNNPALREFPSPERFPRVQTMLLSYAYHCCSFLSIEVEESVTRSPVRESILFPTDDFDSSLWNSTFSDIWPQLDNLTDKFGSRINELWANFGSDFTYPGNLPSYVEDYFDNQDARTTAITRTPSRIQCLPQPGPFLPCQDLFDWWTLRCGVWIVFLLAMLGNGTVVFVLIFSRSKMDVPRFLVCNLAAADFFMGVYLGLLAVVDASTLGEFRMYAIPWQMSPGCQLAGFLGVLSSELSVYTLAVITLERNYAITHAMHLNKRLSLKHAGYIMTIGWCFALSMASLPLLGVSDYRKFAICLPFETNGSAALAYVVFLMLINGVAFLILMGCYLKMYCAIRGSQAWNSNDSRIAKRMALLVFTDFLCWSPIAFFSLTATFGLQLVSLEQAKVFAVFVLPLNSCCNPFLYAILTKQFKKDCVLICKAIEESRVTRGIGRCRHSSNFSNRQTPANTNSLVDRSSRENQGPLQTPCACGNSRLLETGSRCSSYRWWSAGIFWPCTRDSRHARHTRSDQYAYQIAQIQQKQHKRASSVSSSENFSSSRSDSWRQAHHCGIPLRLLDPKRRASSWLITRKPSQDSNLSSSRNDSSGSATTASTSTWRISRSSASLEISGRNNTPRPVRPKPRLTRQLAIQEPEPPGSPSRLAVRLLATIPSAAETSDQQDDENMPTN